VAGTVAAAMVLFALFAHRGPPLIVVSGVSLLVAAAVIGRSLRGAPQPLELLGLRGSSRLGIFALVAIAVGAAAGMLQRNHIGLLQEPTSGLKLFVVPACLIGVAEELVYRGWLLGRISALGAPAAVVIAAVAHAVYKTALFAWPPDAVGFGFNLAGIALLTVAGGLVLGILRVTSRSVWPAVLAHAAFDALVYSAYTAAPWWVWR